MGNKLPSFKEYHNDPEVIEEIAPALVGLGMGAAKLGGLVGRGALAAGKAALPALQTAGRGALAAGKAALPALQTVGRGALAAGRAITGVGKGVGNALSTVADVASMGSGVVDIAKQQLASTAPGVPAEGYTKEKPTEPEESMPQNMVKKMIPGMVDQVVAAAGEKNMKVAQQALKKAAQDIGKPKKKAGQL